MKRCLDTLPPTVEKRRRVETRAAAVVETRRMKTRTKLSSRTESGRRRRDSVSQARALPEAATDVAVEEKSSVLRTCEKNTVSLTDLPDDILYRIADHVQPGYLFALAQTCRTMKRICSDELLWRKKTKAKFGLVTKWKSQSWRRMYGYFSQVYSLVELLRPESIQYSNYVVWFIVNPSPPRVISRITFPRHLMKEVWRLEPTDIAAAGFGGSQEEFGWTTLYHSLVHKHGNVEAMQTAMLGRYKSYKPLVSRAYREYLPSVRFNIVLHFFKEMLWMTNYSPAITLLSELKCVLDGSKVISEFRRNPLIPDLGRIRPFLEMIAKFSTMLLHGPITPYHVKDVLKLSVDILEEGIDVTKPELNQWDHHLMLLLDYAGRLWQIVEMSKMGGLGSAFPINLHGALKWHSVLKSFVMDGSLSSLHGAQMVLQRRAVFLRWWTTNFRLLSDSSIKLVEVIMTFGYPEKFRRDTQKISLSIFALAMEFMATGDTDRLKLLPWYYPAFHSAYDGVDAE